MAVYVDEIGPCIKSCKWPYNQSAHLMADTVEELHEFAARLGLKREWFQDRKTGKHYDLTVRMWYKARQAGAQLVNGPKFLELVRR